MSLDVDPPTLDARDPNEYQDANVAADADYRREELAEFLRAGAWEEAFADWAAGADVTEEEFRTASETGLFEGSTSPGTYRPPGRGPRV